MDPDLASLPPGGTLVLRVIKRPPAEPAKHTEPEEYEEEGEGEYADAEGEAEEAEFAEGQEEEEYYEEGEENYNDENSQPNDEEVEGEQDAYYEDHQDVKYENDANVSKCYKKLRFNKPAQCTLCNCGFENPNALFEHKKAEHNLVQCGLCHDYVKGLDNLSKHFETEHDGEQHYSCSLCTATFACQNNYERHQRSHKQEESQGNGYKCSQCNYICSTQNLLSRHHHVAHRTGLDSQEYKPYICHVCGASFKFDFTCEAHLKAHKSGEVDRAIRQESEYEVTTSQQTHDSSSEAQNDANEAHQAAKRIKLEDTSNSEGQTETQRAESPANNFELDKSQLVMTDSKPFQCPKCPFTFRWKVSLQVHMRTHEVQSHFQAVDASQPPKPRTTFNPNFNPNSSPGLTFQPDLVQEQINQIASRRTVIFRPPNANMSSEDADQLKPVAEFSNPQPQSIVQHRAPSQFDTEQANVQGGEVTVAETEGLQPGQLYVQGPDGQLLPLDPSDAEKISAGETVYITQENGVGLQDGEAPGTTESVQTTEGATYVEEQQVQTVAVKEEAEQVTAGYQGDSQLIADGNTMVTEGVPSEQMVVMSAGESNPSEMIMTSLRLQNDTWCSSLCTTLAEMQRARTMCNLTLVGSDQKSINGHSCMVAAASPSLKNLLAGVKKGAHSVLRFDTISGDLWQLLIEFIYSGRVEVPIANVSDIMVAANHLQIEGLATLCADLLQQYNPTDNIIVQLQIEDWCTHVCGIMLQFWEATVLCDTTLTTADGQLLSTIACILAASSPTFRSILGSMKQGMYNIKTDQISRGTWGHLLQFMFTGECEVPMGKELATLHQATEQLNMGALKSLCADCINSLGDTAVL